MNERFKPGVETWCASDSDTSSFSVVFEDDGDTGYVYAWDRSNEQPVLDAVHLYDAKTVVDRDSDSAVTVVWSGDGLKALLLLNDWPQALIDFASRCTFCRTDWPPPPRGWGRAPLDDDLIETFSGATG
jgi:hypothetical protein